MAKISYIIAGPTASGKSDFAHKLAKKIGGTIINADSVQIYKDIENISASPLTGHDGGSAIIDGVPYKLYSVRDLGGQMSVAEYLELARAEFDAAEVPIFVGGSGYYVNALVNGISPIPKISSENRKLARKMTTDSRDDARKTAGCKFSDPQRIARALEVFLETGRPLSEWQKLPRIGAIQPAPIKILIMPPREILARRIRARLPEMLTNGGLDEVKKYIGFPDRAIGIEEVGKYVRDEIPHNEALENWAVRTCQYAKRQRTWFARQYDADIKIMRVPTDEDLDSVFDFVKNNYKITK